MSAFVGGPVIDGWVNVNMSAMGTPDYLVEVARSYFKQGEDFFRDYSIEEMLEIMDAEGVERAILTVDARRPAEKVLEFTDRHPDRFALGAQLDPTRLMKSVRELAALAASHRVVLARITPFFFDLPPGHRVYYPIYTKCVELDLPLTINTGIPGPPAPAECQDPIHLDRVCLDFPELKLVMAHGADPWWGVAIRLMLKYRNLHMMTSAYLPKYLPPELLHFMNTRGSGKVMFASDHPAIQLGRCVQDARRLELRDGVLEKYLYENAARLFFDEQRQAGA